MYREKILFTHSSVERQDRYIKSVFEALPSTDPIEAARTCDRRTFRSCQKPDNRRVVVMPSSSTTLCRACLQGLRNRPTQRRGLVASPSGHPLRRQHSSGDRHAGADSDSSNSMASGNNSSSSSSGTQTGPHFAAAAHILTQARIEKPTFRLLPSSRRVHSKISGKKYLGQAMNTQRMQFYIC